MLDKDPQRRPAAADILSRWVMTDFEKRLALKIEENSALKEKISHLEMLLKDNEIQY